MKQQALIIDCDVAMGEEHMGKLSDVDDAFVLFEALNSTDFALLACTTVFGNATEEQCFRVLEKILELKNQRELPHASGASVEFSQCRESNSAVELMRSVLEEKRAKLLAIGPLTNVALLIKNYPEVLDNIEEIVAVMGRHPKQEFKINGRGPLRDFNFELDPEAAKIVVDSGLPLTLAAFEVGVQCMVGRSELEKIKVQHSDLSDWVYRTSMDWLEHWEKIFQESGFHPWDSLALAWLRSPQFFDSEMGELRIDGNQLIFRAKKGGTIRWLRLREPVRLVENLISSMRK